MSGVPQVPMTPAIPMRGREFDIRMQPKTVVALVNLSFDPQVTASSRKLWRRMLASPRNTDKR